jgi:F-type H+-transporting ATPase subunit a
MVKENILNYNIKKLIVTISLLICAIFILPGDALAAADNHNHESEVVEEVEEKLDAGALILDHIMDSYEWHICTWKGKHISISLPIIVLSEGELYVFSSKHLHHGHEYVTLDRYGEEVRFKIPDSGKYEGKVVRFSSDDFLTRPLDFSITKTVFGLFVSCALLVIIFLLVAKSYRQRGVKAPKGIQALIEPLVIYVRDEIAKPNIGKNYEKYLPYLLTVFFFIIFNNILGLIPIFPFGANVTGNIAVTAVLALFTFFITNLTGKRHYYQDIFNTPGVPWWLKFPLPLMPIIEVVGCFIKPFVLAIRLFANITAGHIIVLGFITMIFILGEMSAMAGAAGSVVALLLAVFVDCLELLVAFIQAYVFTLLSALYFGAAAKEGH